MSGPWPDPVQEFVLAACFGAGLEQVPAHPTPSLHQLTPLLYRRWPHEPSALIAEGKRAYLATWRQNQERLEHLHTFVGALREAGIPSIVLKGAALALCHYRDLGVRGMRDFDVLVPERDVERAIACVLALGYVAEDGLSAEAIRRRTRVGHAWQFAKGEQTCDLHWRPVVRCFSPEVTRLFWEGGRADGEVTVLSPTDQLFHVCAHGLQWDWQPQVRWVADALTVMEQPVDWERIALLAKHASMEARVGHALQYLRVRFAAPVPGRFLDTAPGWQRREYRLMLKPCPLGMLDSAEWHIHHFRRIRPFDAHWGKTHVAKGFLEYLREFLGARGTRDAAARLRDELKARARLKL